MAISYQFSQAKAPIMMAIIKAENFGKTLHEEWLEAKDKRKMLECQWKRRSGEVKECEECENRFLCHTITANRFNITESQLVQRTYEIYAESKHEALNVLDKYDGDKDIAPVIDFEPAEDGDTIRTIDELDYKGEITRQYDDCGEEVITANNE